MGQVQARLHRRIDRLIRCNSNSTHSRFSAKNVERDMIHQDTVTSIENLINATVADKETATSLTNIISNPTFDLVEDNAKLVKALVDNTTLTNKLADRRTNIPRLLPRNSSYTQYFWTHGITSFYSSNYCITQAAGHQVDEPNSTR